MVPDKLFENVFQEQEWASTYPILMSSYKRLTNLTTTTVSNLTRLTIQQQFGELELQAIYGPLAGTGFENDRFVGVATLGNQLLSTFVCSEPLLSRFSFRRLRQRRNTS